MAGPAAVGPASRLQQRESPQWHTCRRRECGTRNDQTSVGACEAELRMRLRYGLAPGKARPAEVGNGDPNLQERRALCLRRRSGASMSACPRHRCGAMGPWDVHVPLAGGYSRCGGPHSRVRAAYVNVYLSAAHDPPPVPTQPPSSGHGQTDERACISQPSESSAPSNPPAGRRNRRTRRQRSQQSSPPAGLTTAGTPWNVFIDAFIADWGMFIHLNPDLDDLLAKAEQVSCIPATIDGLASRLASPAEVTGELELELKNLGLPADKWVESVFQSARCGGYAFRRALIAALKRDTAPEQRSTVTAFVDSYCMAPVGDGRYTAGTRSFDAESRYYYIMYLTALRCRVCGAPSDHDDDDDDDGDDAWGRSVCGDYDVTAADDTTFEAFADFDDYE